MTEEGTTVAARPRSRRSEIQVATALEPDAVAPPAAAGASEERPMLGPERRADVLPRLDRTAGRSQGISPMVESDPSCAKVLTQTAAAQAPCMVRRGSSPATNWSDVSSTPSPAATRRSRTR